MQRHQKNRKIRAIAPMIAVSLFLGCLMILPSEASADTTYWSSAFVPSHNSTHMLSYGKAHVDYSPIEEAQVHGDGEKEDLYGVVAYTHTITTNDFSNTSEWVDPGTGGEYWEVVGYMPPPDATIQSVILNVVFTIARPQTELAFTINNGSTWTSSGLIAASTYATSWNWNITTLADWSVSILNGTDLWAEGTFYTVAYTHYYLDYLGFTVSWYGEYAGGGTGGVPPDPESDEEGGAEIGYDFIYSAEGIVGLLGLFGLVGMIAAPALGIYIYRQTDEGRMVLFIKMLVFFMVCLTMFMVSVNA